MCVAIVRPSDAPIIDSAVLAACFAANPHGAGFAWVSPDTNRVAIHKGFFGFKVFLDALRKTEKEVGNKSPFLIHFRVSTGGGQTTENCHPFRIEHGAVMHNGYLFYVNGDKSDTRKFAERIGPKLSKEGLALHKATLEESLGTSNKLAVLFHDKSYQIVNEKAGDWIDKSWYSNTIWRARMEGGGGTRAPMSFPRDISGYNWRERRADAHAAFGESRGFGGREG
jgi:hypothetical protein